MADYAAEAIARDAGWHPAPHEPRGVVRRAATEDERRSNGGQPWVFAHSWRKAVTYDRGRNLLTLLTSSTCRHSDHAIRSFSSADGIPPGPESEVNLMIATEIKNYSGHVFIEDPEVRKDGSTGPGWFIFARNSEKYGKFPNGKGAYVKLVAWPDGKRRYHVHYNSPVLHGWRLKRDAQKALEDLKAAGLFRPNE